MNWDMVSDGWTGFLRTVVVGTIGYSALVLLLRTSGKRTLSKMNAFDLVVTIALGSAFATVLLSKDVSLVTGITAMALLIALQYVVAWSSVRSGFVRRAVRSEPRLLVRRGQMLDAAMRSERVSRDELLSAIRSEGLAGLHQVEAVVLESDGTFSVVRTFSGGEDSALRAVPDYDRSI